MIKNTETTILEKPQTSGGQCEAPCYGATRKEVIGDCVLYLGDCSVVLPSLPTFDLILTDPPYGLDMGNKRIGTARKAPVNFDGDDSWDSAKPPFWLFLMMADKSKNMVTWGGNYFGLPPSASLIQL